MSAKQLVALNKQYFVAINKLVPSSYSSSSSSSYHFKQPLKNLFSYRTYSSSSNTNDNNNKPTVDIFNNNKELLKQHINMMASTQTNTQRYLPAEKQKDWIFNTHTMTDVFRGIPDIFDGITVDDVAQYPSDIVTFELHLKNSLKYWTENKRRGIWIKVPQARAELIHLVVKEGFEFHHCQSDYLMLTKWLPSDVNRLPEYTTHYIGCGGLVINEKNEILLITEKQRPDKWKIPGGALDSGEDICKTAVREVWEETGVKTEFVSVLGFRHLHNYAFNRGDIYYICALKPLSQEINLDPNEIAFCKWTPIKEFVENKNTFPLQSSVARLAYEYCYNGYKGFKADEVSNSIKTGNSYIYHGSNADLSDLVWKGK